MHKSILFFVLYVLAIASASAVLLVSYWSIARDLRLLSLFSA
ncbi:hypothetical protein [Verticiella sediminum]|nr:hypothetical protein [Verticiella sediminum]